MNLVGPLHPFSISIASRGRLCLLMILSTLFMGSCAHSIISPNGPDNHINLTRSRMGQVLNLGNILRNPRAACPEPMSLDQCRTIALSNNLTLISAGLSEISAGYVESSHWVEMLPRLSFTGHYDVKDNEEYAYGDVLGAEGEAPELGPGDGVTHYSTSEERNRWRHLLEISWRPTDAVLAYYLAKSARKDKLNRHYEKVRLAQKILETVEASYHRILSAQSRLPQARELVRVREKVAKASRELLSDQLMDVEQYKIAKADLINARSYLARTRSDLSRHRSVLLTAMGLTPDNCNGPVTVTGALCPPQYRPVLCEVEKSAVMNRPEAYQAGIAHLKSIDKLRSSQIGRFPSVNLFWRRTGDTNKFLYNNDWKEFGITAQIDLIQWLSNHRKVSANKLDAHVTSNEMAAVGLTLAAQARMAALDYLSTLERLQTVEESLRGSVRVYENFKQKATQGAIKRLSLDKAYGDMIFDRLEKIRLLGEANACLAKIRSAMGINYQAPVPNE